MPLRRLALLSAHTSPLAQPGAGDGGGLNVYVRALASALARAGVECDVLTRRDHAGQPATVVVEPGFRVLHLDAGPAEPIDRTDLAQLVPDLVAASMDRIAAEDASYDLLHANYWISGAVAHRLKHELDLPLAVTFHTLGRVKAGAGLLDDVPERGRSEQETIACSDLVLASTAGERDELARLYDAPLDRIEVVAPGVDHDVFDAGTPGQRATDRAGLGLGGAPALLFAGRIQSLKGADLAVRTLAALPDRRAVLLVVGGPSGADGAAEMERLHALVRALGVVDRVRFVPPQPHERLAQFYRAVDVCLVPSRAESFGLVALEAAACGTPVVATAVGGLRSVVEHGVTGFLVDGRDPLDFVVPVTALVDDGALAARVGAAAQHRSRRYGWSMTAARLRRLYADLLAREPVSCR